MGDRCPAPCCQACADGGCFNEWLAAEGLTLADDGACVLDPDSWSKGEGE